MSPGLFKYVIALLTVTSAVTAKPVEVRRELETRQNGAYVVDGDFNQPLGQDTWHGQGAVRVQRDDGNYVLQVTPLKSCPDPGTLKGYLYGHM